MHIRHVTVAVAVFFISAVPACASFIGLSNDPVYAEQFSFYCRSYGAPFEAGRHYLPVDGPCVYSIPSTLTTGNKQILLMKGIPGVGAVIKAAEFGNFGPITLLNQSPNIFADAVDEDDYFATIYNATLDQNATPLLDYLSGATSTLPAGVVEGQNFFILPWKWGPKPVSEFNPAIIVPDVLDTWQTDSGPVVDPLFNQYQNFADTLEANGYVPDQTLFYFPYDWRQSHSANAIALGNTIDSVKSTCACDKVDLVTHGMGGIIALEYLRDTDAFSSVAHVALLGVPQAGIPASYLAWEGGQVSLGNALQSGLAQSLLRQEATNSGYSGVYQYLQGVPASSFLEMLPVYNYLDGKSYPTGYPTNSFLEDLQNNMPLTFLDGKFYSNGAHVITSIGGGQSTTKSFAVTTSTNPPLWADGEPTLTHTTTAGDGMVPEDSSLFLFGPDYTYNVPHNALPTSAASDLFTVFNRRAPTSVVNNNYPVSCVLFISTTPITDLLLTDPNNLRLGKDIPGSGILDEIPNSLYSGYNQPTEYIAVANPVQGTYTVQTQGASSGSFTINATDVCGNGTAATSTTGTTDPGQVIGYEVTVDPDAGTIDIEVLDNQPPVVTIFTPQDGATYLSTDEVFITENISDPEDSPIGTVSYELNGAPVNHLEALPLGSVPLGTNTLVVSATDIAGNTGYATSTFNVDAPPPMWPQFGDFLPPITAAGHQINENTSVFKAGSNVPVKFELLDENGNSVEDSGSIVWIAPVRGPMLNTSVSATTTESVLPTSGNYYDWKGSHYQYNWKTSKSDKGYWYYLFVVLNDGSIYQTVVGLK